MPKLYYIKYAELVKQKIYRFDVTSMKYCDRTALNTWGKLSGFMTEKLSATTCQAI